MIGAERLYKEANYRELSLCVAQDGLTRAGVAPEAARTGLSLYMERWNATPRRSRCYSGPPNAFARAARTGLSLYMERWSATPRRSRCYSRPPNAFARTPKSSDYFFWGLRLSA